MVDTTVEGKLGWEGIVECAMGYISNPVQSIRKLVLADCRFSAFYVNKRWHMITSHQFISVSRRSWKRISSLQKRTLSKAMGNNQKCWPDSVLVSSPFDSHCPWCRIQLAWYFCGRYSYGLDVIPSSSHGEKLYFLGLAQAAVHPDAPQSTRIIPSSWFLQERTPRSYEDWYTCVYDPWKDPRRSTLRGKPQERTWYLYKRTA